MSGLEWVLVTVALTLGASVQGAVGFGFALTTVPVLVLADPRLVPGPFLLAGMTLSLLVGWRDREHAEWSEVGWAVLGRMGGAIVGAGVVAVLSVQTRGVVVGAAVLAAVLVSLVGVTVPFGRPSLLGAGATAGVMGTVAGLDGPPMALLYQHHHGSHIRANLARFFIVGSLQSALVLSFVGAFGARQAGLGLLLAPGTLLGYVLSGHLIRVLDARWTRPAVLAMSAAGGSAVLLRALW